MALVVADGGGGLVVHHQLDALGVRVVVKGLQVEVRIWGDEIEDVILGVAEPIFPALVPALDEDLVEAVLGGEVDVATHLLVVCCMCTVGLHLGVVRHAEFHREQIVGVGPCGFADDHLPPHTDVFHGLDPGDVFQGAGFVKVQREMRGEDLACIVAHHDGAPGGVAGCLHVPLLSLCIGREP